MISFTCAACGKTLRVKDEMAGKSGKCPCGAPVKIPAASSQAVQAVPPAPAPAADFQSPAPVASGKGRGLLANKKLVMGGAAALLLIIAVVAVAMLFTGGSGGFQQDAAYLPDNTQMVLSFRVRDALDSSLYQKLSANTPMLKEGLDEFTQQSGFDLNKVDRMTLAFDPNAKDPIGLVRFQKPIEFSEIKAARKVPEFRQNVNYEETKVNDRSIFLETYESKWITVGGDPNAPQPKAKRHNGTAYGMADSRLALVGDEVEELKKILQRGQAAKLDEGMQKGIALADFNKTLAFVLNVKGLMANEKAARELKRGMGGMPGMDNMFSGVEVIAGEVAIGTDVEAHAVMLCKNAATAEELKKSIDGLLSLGKLFLSQSPDVPKELNDVLNSLKLSVSGAEIHASATLSGAVVETLAKKMGESQPRPMRRVDSPKLDLK